MQRSRRRERTDQEPDESHLLTGQNLVDAAREQQEQKQ
jgi:hypothetical protein